jgi:hypothetical protein
MIPYPVNRHSPFGLFKTIPVMAKNPKIEACALALNTKDASATRPTRVGPIPDKPETSHLPQEVLDLQLATQDNSSTPQPSKVCIGAIWDKELLYYAYNPFQPDIGYLDPSTGYENWYPGSEGEVHPHGEQWVNGRHVTTVGQYRYAKAPPFKRWEDEEELKFHVEDPRQSGPESPYPEIDPSTYATLNDFKDWHWIKSQVDPCPGRACSTSNFLTVEYGVRWANHTQCD